MSRQLHILYLEDNPTDVELVKDYLSVQDIRCECTIATDRDSFVDQFKSQRFDLILSDYKLPTFDGLTALQMVREVNELIPFIIISGMIGEDFAVECMREGATDYVIKQNLFRLAPAIQRAMDEYEIRIKQQEDEQTLKAVLRSAPVGIALIQELTIQLANQHFAELCGCSQSELIGADITRFIKDVALVNELYIEKHSAPKNTFSFESILHRKSQETIHILLRFSLVDPQAPMRGGVISVLNISMQKRMIAALKQEEAFFASLVDNIPMNLIRKDRDGKVTYMNQQACQLFGITVDEAIGKTDSDLFPQELAEKYMRDDRRILDTGGKLDMIEQTHRADGSRIFVHTIKTPVRDANEDIVGLQLIFWDVTQAVLKDEEIKQLYTAIEQSPNSVVITDKNGCIEYVNKKFTEVTGYSSTEAKGKNPHILKSDKHPREFYQDMWDTITKGKTWRNRICNKKKSGALYWESCSISPLLDDEGNIINYIAVKEDITEDLRIQDEIKRSEEFSKGILNSLTSHIAIINEEGTIVAVNEAWRKFAGENGIQCEKVEPCCIGINYLEICQVAASIANEDQEDAQNVLDGIHRVINGSVEEFFYEYPCHSFREKRWFNLKATRLHMENSQYIVLAHENISEQKGLEEMLLQAQKMEAVGRLAGGVAHDFNNLLLVIKSYSDFALEEIDADNNVHDDLNEIKQAADRASALTRQLLAFSRQQIMEPQIIDLNMTIDNLNKMIGRLIGEDIEYITTLTPDLSNIKADPGQIDQVIINLVVNARDAMPKGGTIHIETQNTVLDEDYCSLHPDVTAGTYVMLSLSDTGIGMDAETKAKIFEPFFTTKAKGEGTGLGLSTIFGIVKQSHGHIYVYSEPGRGTSFKVYLPATTEQKEIEMEAVEEPSITTHETILLVEDEDSVRHVVERILLQDGFNVISASTPSEAIALYRDNSEKIDLLVSDVIMPEMNGIEMYEQLVSIMPTLRVLFMSGYTDNAIITNGILEKGLEHIQKPFSTDTLLKKIKRVLKNVEHH